LLKVALSTINQSNQPYQMASSLFVISQSESDKSFKYWFTAQWYITVVYHHYPNPVSPKY
jgi:hypothetical protein